jgi:hypothetical protein
MSVHPAPDSLVWSREISRRSSRSSRRSVGGWEPLVAVMGLCPSSVELLSPSVGRQIRLKVNRMAVIACERTHMEAGEKAEPETLDGPDNVSPVPLTRWSADSTFA